MKKDRNCGCGNTPYPTYPGMYNQGIMVPNMPVPLPPNYGYLNTPNMMMPPNNMIQGVSSNTLEQQISQLQQQINNLERRVTMLENINQNNTTSFGSNYQML